MCTLWHYLGSNLRGYLKFYFSFEFRKARLRVRDEFTKAFVFVWSQRSDQVGATEVPEQIRCVHIRSCLLLPDSFRSESITCPPCHAWVCIKEQSQRMQTELFHELHSEVELQGVFNTQGQTGVNSL